MSQKTNLSQLPPMLTSPSMQSGLSVMQGQQGMLSPPPGQSQQQGGLSPVAQNYMLRQARMLGINPSPSRPNTGNNSFLRFSY